MNMKITITDQSGKRRKISFQLDPEKRIYSSADLPDKKNLLIALVANSGRPECWPTPWRLVQYSKFLPNDLKLAKIYHLLVLWQAPALFVIVNGNFRPIFATGSKIDWRPEHLDEYIKRHPGCFICSGEFTD